MSGRKPDNGLKLATSIAELSRPRCGCGEFGKFRVARQFMCPPCFRARPAAAAPAAQASTVAGRPRAESPMRPMPGLVGYSQRGRSDRRTTPASSPRRSRTPLGATAEKEKEKENGDGDDYCGFEGSFEGSGEEGDPSTCDVRSTAPDVQPPQTSVSASADSPVCTRALAGAEGAGFGLGCAASASGSTSTAGHRGRSTKRQLDIARTGVGVGAEAKETPPCKKRR